MTAIIVSSRAPVWGASSAAPPLDHSVWQFQVVPPCGGHRPMISTPTRFSWFQVVPPCGGHPQYGRPRRGRPGRFKSCPRVGGIQLGRKKGQHSGGFKSCPRVGGIRRAV